MLQAEDKAEIPGEHANYERLFLTINSVSAKIVNQGRIPTVENRVQVQLNGYSMDLRQAVPVVSQFEIRFTGIRSYQPKGQQLEQTKEYDLAKGPRNE